MRDLRKRGKGRRESGAFLLGVRGKKQDVVKKYIPYDELDPHALDSGIIVVRPIGFMKLWQDCKRLKLQVLADVHTHPGAWTDQSDSDRTHPMISQAGHIALIVPQFAASRCCKFNGVGIFDYLGDYKWNDLRGPNRRRRLSFRLW
jgi:proteasome lid subunit RPN8/RPN11